MCILQPHVIYRRDHLKSLYQYGKIHYIELLPNLVIFFLCIGRLGRQYMGGALGGGGEGGGGRGVKRYS